MADWLDALYPEPPQVPGVPDALAGVAEEAEQQQAAVVDWPPAHWGAPEEEPQPVEPERMDLGGMVETLPEEPEPTTAELFGAAYQPQPGEPVEPVEPEPEVAPSFAPGVATYDQWIQGEQRQAARDRRDADVAMYGDELTDARYEAEELSDEELAERETIARNQAEQRKAKEIEDLAKRKQNEEREALELKQQSRQRTIAKLEALNEQWEQLANQKIDTERWWSNRSTGQKAANYIAAAFSGFLDPGGENQAIKGMQQAIDRDIAAQREDIANGRASLQARGNLVSQMYQITGDLETAQDAARVAMYGAAEQEIAARAARFDPFGTAARQAQMSIRKVRAQKQAGIDALKDKQYERDQDAAKFELDVWKAEQENEHKRRQLAEQRAGRIEARKRREADEAARKAAEKKREEQEASDKVRKFGVAARKGRYFVNDDGSVFMAPTEDEAKKIRAKKAALEQGAKLVDNIKRMQPGGDLASLSRSEKSRRLQSAHEYLKIVVKNAEELGALTEGDMAMVDKQVGKDLTEFRGATLAPMMEWMDNTTDGFNAELNSLGYSGPVYKPLRTAPDDAVSAPTDAEAAIRDYETKDADFSTVTLPGFAPGANKLSRAIGERRRSKAIDILASAALGGSGAAQEALEEYAKGGDQAAKDALEYVRRGGRRLIRTGGDH